MTTLSAPSIPTLVRQHLSQKNIPHQLVRKAPELEHIEVCLLQDEQGLVQVFTLSSTVVEIDKVRKLTGRELQPLTCKTLQALKNKLGLHALPAFDTLIQAETLIDSAVLEQQPIYINAGDAEHLLQLQTTSALQQKDSTQIANCATAIPLTSVSYELSLYDHDRSEINNAVTKFTALRIRQRLEETLEVPPLPDTAQSIIRLRVDPDANIEKLSQIVERDPSLAAQVVSWASSSYYSAPGSIKSVQDAIVRVLGYDLVMNLALGLSLGKTLDLPEQNNYESVPYWQQAVYVAACVGALVSAVPREFRPGFGLSYLAGLLHNFGYLIMAHAFKPHFDATQQMIALNRHLDHQHVEKHVLGITRDQMAASLMLSWNMPAEVTNGIRYQSDPHYLGANSDQAHLIYVAKHLLRQYQLLPPRENPFNDAVFEHLKLSQADLDTIMARLRDNREELDMIAHSLDNGT